MKARHVDGEYDSLGRPAIYPSYRPERNGKKQRDIEEERKERRRRVESYIKSSNMSLVRVGINISMNPFTFLMHDAFIQITV